MCIAVGKHRRGRKAAGDAQALGGIESSQTSRVAPARTCLLTELEAATGVEIDDAARELSITLKQTEQQIQGQRLDREAYDIRA